MNAFKDLVVYILNMMYTQTNNIYVHVYAFYEGTFPVVISARIEYTNTKKSHARKF